MHHLHPEPRPSADAGVTLVEVIVAMVVFGIIATGIIGGISIAQRMTPDNEAREVAAGLAGQEIDLVRAIGDPYQVGARTVTQTINGRAFTIERDTEWLSASGSQSTCGAALTRFELQVNVDVSWNDQAETTNDVRTDTILAPTSTVTDAKTGAFAVQVSGSDGSPQAGVTVTVTPEPTLPNGASAPASQPAATGSDGCTYVSKLTPGNYTVTVARTGSGTQTKTLQPVTAGTTTTVPFTAFDGVATLVRRDAANTDGLAMVPNDLVVSYLNGTAGLSSSSAASVSVRPYSAGYTAVAGKLGPTGGLTTCAEFDPAAWGSGTSNGKPVGNGSRLAAAAPLNGQTKKIQVPMGTVTLKGADGEWVEAVQASPTGTENPGCSSATTTLHFDQLSGDSVELALPYGVWTLFTGTDSATQSTPVAKADITATSNAAGGGVAADGTVTLDPRPLS